MKMNPVFMMIAVSSVAGLLLPSAHAITKQGDNRFSVSITELRGMCEEYLTSSFDKAVTSFDHKIIPTIGRVGDGDNEIQLGEKVDSGSQGAVYAIERFTDLRIAGDYEGALTLKLPYSIRESKQLGPYVFVADSTVRELAEYRFLQDHLRQIQRDPNHPPDSSWVNENPPIVPIFSAVSTEYGLGLVKPLVVGLSGKNIGGVCRMKQCRIPEFMVGSLRELYGFAQSVYRQSAKNRKIYALDIGPTNLIWVHTPEMRRLLNMKRAGFALYRAKSTDRLEYIDRKTDSRGFGNFEHYVESVYQSFLEQAAGQESQTVTSIAPPSNL